MSKKENTTQKESTKKEYETPKIDSEEILEAGLMAVCNGTTGGPDNMKVTAGTGCTTKKS